VSILSVRSKEKYYTIMIGISGVEMISERGGDQKKKNDIAKWKGKFENPSLSQNFLLR